MTDTAENLTDLAAAKAPAEKRSNLIKIPKKILTDKTIKKLLKNKTRAEPGQRYTIWDAGLPGFGVRVTDRHLSYIFGGRFPGSKSWTRREIGAVDAMSLAAAHAIARDWIEIAKQGKDPKAEMERREREEARKKDHTFASVVEAYIGERVIGPNPERPIMRKWKYVARVLRDPFGKTLKERPIATIDRADILAIIKLKKKRHPAEARSQLAVVKSLFSWAVDQSFGLERSVCSDIAPRAVIGEKNSRERALNDDEVRALWTVADRTPYPVGPIYKMLLLTGLRRNEVVRASWSEFDLAKRTWIIPAARMKGRNVGSDGKRARAHLVPLTAPMLQILNTLPTFKGGDLLFSTTKGKKPLWMGSKVKNAIDIAMLEQLRSIAAERGNDPAKIELEEWVNHDLRRTVRSNLSALKVVKEEVSEAILAHAKIGIVGTYNVYQYADEKGEALDLWAVRLHEIVNPPPPEPAGDNVLHPSFGKAMTQ
jgi:integrase